MNEKVTCSECRHFNAETNYCKRSEATVRPRYGCYEGEERIVTNGDRIRSMDDVKLARFLFLTGDNCARCAANEVCDFEKGCVENIYKWLRLEVRDE